MITLPEKATCIRDVEKDMFELFFCVVSIIPGKSNEDMGILCSKNIKEFEVPEGKKWNNNLVVVLAQKRVLMGASFCPNKSG